MTHEELKELLARSEELVKKSNYNEAEMLAETVLAELEQATGSGESQAANKRETLRCSALTLLSTVNTRRGDYQTALTLANTALGIAEAHTLSDLKAKALVNIGLVHSETSDYTNALTFYLRALALSEEIGSKSGIAGNLGNIGNVYNYLSEYDKALMYYQRALAINEEIKNKGGIAKNLTGIGAMKRRLLDFEQALAHYQQALALNEEIGDKKSIATNLSSIGILYSEISDYTLALEYCQQALAINEEIGNKAGIANNLGSIGNVFGYLSDNSQALVYYQKALAINEEIGNKAGIASNLGNSGNIYNLLCDYDNALSYYQRALTINEDIGNRETYSINLGNIGSVHKDLEQYESAEEYFLKALRLSEEIGAEYPRLHWLAALGSLYSEAKNLSDNQNEGEKYLKLAIADSTALGVKHITRDASQDCYQLYKEQERWQEALAMKELHDTLKDEINVEEVKKEESIRQQQKEIELAKAKADAKHQATEQLLHNVLPPSIAYRMLEGEKLIAEKLSCVSVLFADIVNFTKLSQQISAEELVEGLDRIFSSFDALAEKHGLEKIKTIGDAYMVVAGAPEQRDDHAEVMANFALEMLEAMKEFRSISTGEEIRLRIGIHSGEVVAGVIGKKKFAYDMWGDAVNTASRMESHGEAGRIHCSAEFMWETAANHPEFRFVERGEIEIKGKGKMRTYFLERNV